MNIARLTDLYSTASIIDPVNIYIYCGIRTSKSVSVSMHIILLSVEFRFNFKNDQKSVLKTT